MAPDDRSDQFARRFAVNKKCLGLLRDTSRWCLETCWKDGRRDRKYEATELQDTLVQAGVLVRFGGLLSCGNSWSVNSMPLERPSASSAEESFPWNQPYGPRSSHSGLMTSV